MRRVTNKTIQREVCPPQPTARHQLCPSEQNTLIPSRKLRLTPWRDFLAVTDYRPATSPPFAPKAEPVSLLAAIPAFNEQKTIGSIVLTAQRYAEKVIVIDDGSEDETAWVAERAGATVIRHPTNRGYGAALRSCFEYAPESEFEVLVILDGDGQHRPEMIPQVVAPVNEGRAAVSIGSRFLDGNKAGGAPAEKQFRIARLRQRTC